MQVSEIKAALSSDNINILKQSLSFVTERITVERLRSTRAETRATSILAVAGILAGFVVHFSRIFGTLKLINWLFLFIIYIASILFLLKAALFAIKAHWSLKGYELKPDLAFELNKLSECDALREELTWKIWEYYQLLPIGNERLFWTNRAQRNILTAIISFSILGICWFFFSNTELLIPHYAVIFLLLVFLILILFLDVIFERVGELWRTK